MLNTRFAKSEREPATNQPLIAASEVLYRLASVLGGFANGAEGPFGPHPSPAAMISTADMVKTFFFAGQSPAPGLRVILSRLRRTTAR